MANPNTDLSTDPLVEQSQDAMTSMEAEAAEFFAARDAERVEKALNPVAPALEKAAAAPAKAAAKPAPAIKAAPTGKVAGAPTFPKAKEAAEVSKGSAEKPLVSDASSAEAKAVADGKTAEKFEDIPREYKTGNIRAANWDKLHAKADHYESLASQAAAEREALKAELEAVRANASTTAPPDITARLTALQTERDALRSQLESVAGERIFDSEAAPRRSAAIAQAKAAVGIADAPKLDSILALPESVARDNALEELLATLSPLRATKLASAVASLDQLTAERSAAASRGGELWNQRLAQQQAQQERANQERISRASSTFEAELKEWAPVGLSAEDIANARSVYSGQGATLQDASRAALWAVAGPKAAQMASELQARVAELEGELGKLRKAQPGVGAAGGGALPANGDGEEDEIATTSYAERIARQSMRAGLRFGT